jgi:hypothetical protein
MHSLPILLVPLLIFAAVMSSALAKPPGKSFRIDVYTGGTKALYTGDIYHGSVEALRTVLDAHPNIELLGLSSSGGRTSVGEDLFLLIRERGLSTFAGKMCASACTLAFMGGEERLLGHGSAIGFHAATNSAYSADPEHFGAAENFASLARPLAEIAGINLTFIDFAYETDPSGLFVPPIKTLIEARFATGQRADVLDDGAVEASYEFAASPFEFAVEALADLRWEDAARHLEASLEAVFPDAHFILGQLYAQGLGVPQDLRRAAELYGVASEAGYAAASHNLGLMMLRGEGIEANEERGLQLIRRAADAGNVEAKFNLARYYTDGRYVERNRFEAFILLTDCANAKFYRCQIELADRYSTGKGAPLDLEKARELYVASLSRIPQTDEMMEAVRARIARIDREVGQ